MHATETADLASTPTFKDLGLSKNILKAIEAVGFTSPSAIQEKVIPKILAGHDLIAQAKTGSGKTAAFGLPTLSMVERGHGIGLLVITPTRELAQQVTDELNRYGAHMEFRALAVYGGQSISMQISAIKRGVQAIVATPGRLLDLLKSKKIPNFAPAHIVLDEADEMLDMGFLEDIQAIFSFFNHERQTLLFSATMPEPIRQLAAKILKKPLTINVNKGEIEHQDIKEIYYLTKDIERDLALVRLIDSHAPTKSIIFCKTKMDVDRLFNKMSSLGYNVRCLHGDMAQRDRQLAIKAFRDGECNMLVATDVAGRGLNVVDISHVFNFHIPFSAESYTHRIGRTGRAGRKGTAITLLSPNEYRQIRRLLNCDQNKIDLRPLPTRSEVHAAHEERLLERVIEQEVNPGAAEVLKRLQGRLNLHEISVSLLSMVLKEKEVTGPEHIGISLEEAKQRPQAPKNGKSRGRFKVYRPAGSGFSKRKNFKRA